MKRKSSLIDLKQNQGGKFPTEAKFLTLKGSEVAADVNAGVAGTHMLPTLQTQFQPMSSEDHAPPSRELGAEETKDVSRKKGKKKIN